MSNPEQKQLFDVLEQQRLNQLFINRIFKIVLPIIAFLLSVVCANLNWQSTLGTFVILWIAFYAVGIQRFSLGLWVAIVTLYAIIDHYFSFGQLNLMRLRFPLITMLLFLGIVGVGRPYIDRWMAKTRQTQ